MTFLRVSLPAGSPRRRSIADAGFVSLAATVVFFSAVSPSFAGHGKAKKPDTTKPHRAEKHRDNPALPGAHALIKVKTAFLRQGPGSDHKRTASLDEGRSARVTGRKGDWVRLRLASGTEGWVRHDLLDVARVEKSAEPRHAGKSHNGSKSEAAAAAHVAAAHAAAEAHRHRAALLAQAAAHSAHKPVAKTAPVHKPTVQVASSKPAIAKPQAPKPAEAVAPATESQAEITTTETVSPETFATSAPTPTAAPIERASEGRAGLVRAALSYRGTPYRMGAMGRGAFDCSGFTCYLFGKEGVGLPRTAADQFSKGQPVEKSAMRPGDLVFFKNTYKQGVSHVGIYIGNNNFVHASGNGRGVRVDTLDKAFYINHWAGARRPR